MRQACIEFRMPHATRHMRACTACMPVLLACAVCVAFGLIARRCSSSSSSHGSDSWPKGWHQLLSAIIKAAAATAFATAAVCLGLTKFKFTTQRRPDLASALHPPPRAEGTRVQWDICVASFTFPFVSVLFIPTFVCVCVCVCASVCVCRFKVTLGQVQPHQVYVMLRVLCK